MSSHNAMVNAVTGISTQRWSIPLLIVFVLWVLALFEPDVWMASGGAEIVRRIPKFIYLALLLMIVLQAPGRVWYFPFLMFVVGGLMASPFAENIGVAQDLVVKILLLYYILAIGSLTFINSVDKTTLLLHLFLWQFLWWILHGGLAGRVPWHPELNNPDGFGPVMVMGMAYCFYFGMAAREQTMRWTGFLLFGLCVAGVVSSFARGAVLASGVVVAYLWARSPRRGRIILPLAIGIVVFLSAVAVLYPEGEFWHEMSTISEGFETGTGLDRWMLWKTAWLAFLERPILGVGAGNFGIFSGAHLYFDPELTYYYHSPGHLWGRSLHSVYFQVLAEFGLFGVIAFIALLVDFWKRNTQLRSASFIAGWRSATHHAFDLRMLSLALEAAMVGYLATGFFYDQLYVHWFYSLLTVNALLHYNAKRVTREQRAIASQ